MASHEPEKGKSDGMRWKWLEREARDLGSRESPTRKRLNGMNQLNIDHPTRFKNTNGLY
jgi:hypothetical protein